jgi:hypothetical protein
MDVDGKNVIVLDDPNHGFKYSRWVRTRDALKVVLEDRRWQFFIIGLVILDACLVCILLNRSQNRCRMDTTLQEASWALR